MLCFRVKLTPGPHRRRFSGNWTKNFISTLIRVLMNLIINAIDISPLKKTAFRKTGGGSSVFCNPPYGREIGKWVEKAYRTNQEQGNLVVMLLPARTDTKWFHEFIYQKAEVRFVRGRLKFGDSKNSAPFPSMVVIYKKKEGADNGKSKGEEKE